MHNSNFKEFAHVRTKGTNLKFGQVLFKSGVVFKPMQYLYCTYVLHCNTAVDFHILNPTT